MLKRIIKNKPIISFFVIAFLFSWITWLPYILATQDSPRYLVIFHLLGGLGPLISAIVVSRITNTYEDFKKTSLKWKLPWIWYGVVLLLPIVMYAVAYIIFIALGAQGTDLSETPSFLLYPVLLLYVILLGGGLEEPGWRGYALPNLQKKYSPLISSLIIGVVWIAWHIPLFFSELTSQQGIPFLWYSITAIALSIIFTIIYNKGHKSALLSIILHGGINAPTAWFPIYAIANTRYGNIDAYIVIAFVSWLTVLILLVTLKPKILEKRNEDNN